MSSEPGTTIFKNLCRNRNLRALPWSGLLSMTRPLQRSSTVPLETRSCTARRPIRHKRRGVPLREETAGVRPSDDDDEDGTRLLACAAASISRASFSQECQGFCWDAFLSSLLTSLCSCGVWPTSCLPRPTAAIASPAFLALLEFCS